MCAHVLCASRGSRRARPPPAPPRRAARRRGAPGRPRRAPPRAGPSLHPPTSHMRVPSRRDAEYRTAIAYTPPGPRRPRWPPAPLAPLRRSAPASALSSRVDVDGPRLTRLGLPSSAHSSLRTTLRRREPDPSQTVMAPGGRQEGEALSVSEHPLGRLACPRWICWGCVRVARPPSEAYSWREVACRQDGVGGVQPHCSSLRLPPVRWEGASGVAMQGRRCGSPTRPALRT
jgi:hypothetical protein